MKRRGFGMPTRFKHIGRFGIFSSVIFNILSEEKLLHASAEANPLTLRSPWLPTTISLAFQITKYLERLVLEASFHV